MYTLLTYEQNLNFNFINRYLHGGRYKTVLEYLRKVERGGNRLRVLDIGCATGTLYGKVAPHFHIEYTGIDPDEEFIEAANQRHGASARFIKGDVSQLLGEVGKQDVICALETLEHIPELQVANLIPQLLQLKPQLFIITVPVEFGPVIWLKNVGSALMGYVRHREYTWLETFWAGFGRWDKLPRHGIGHKGFHWAHLARTVKQHWDVEIRSAPISFLPNCLSPSVTIIARLPVSP